MFWLRRSKRISLGRTWSKHGCFGCAGRNVSRLVGLGRNINVLVAPVETYLAGGTWSMSRSFGRAGQNLSRLVELGRNIDVLVALVKTYLTGSNLVETKMFWSRGSKRISLGRIWSKQRCFGRAGQNVSRLVESGRNIEVCGRAERNLSRLVEFGRNLDVLVAPVETYLAWSNLVET